MNDSIFYEIVDKSIENQNQDNSSLSEEDVMIAALNVFFTGKLTQVAFSQVTRLVNLVSPVQVPVNFDSYAKYLLKSNNDEIMYKKTWFCDACFKTKTAPVVQMRATKNYLYFLTFLILLFVIRNFH